MTLLRGGKEFFPALIERIEAASRDVFLETYIFATDDEALLVLETLKRAAERGVSVNLITDWLGTGRLRTQRLAQALEGTSVNHHAFNRWFLRGAARTHRKLCVVDADVAFVGGINVNHDLSTEEGPEMLPSERWDFAVMVRGPVVEAIHREAVTQWQRTGRLPLLDRLRLLHGTPKKSAALQSSAEGAATAAFLACDNLHHRFTIQREYMRAINGAQHSVLLANPYFAPGRTFRDALAAAAHRGVDVTLLLGVGQFPIQDWVARSYYRKLLGSGVKLVEYRRTQLHAKVAVIDDLWATVGSSNCDGFSLFVNHEANLVVRDPTLASELREEIRRGVVDGIPVAPSDFANLSWPKRLLYGTSFLLYRAAMRLITLNAYG